MAGYYTKFAGSPLKEQGRKIPYCLNHLEGDNKDAYMEDVQIIQSYAEWNYSALVEG